MDDNKKKAGNPMWVAGSKSPNPLGARLRSDPTVSSLIRRIKKGAFSYREVKRRIKGLSDSQYCDLWYKIEALTTPKPSADSLSLEELQAYNDKMEQKVINDARQAKTG